MKRDLVLIVLSSVTLAVVILIIIPFCWKISKEQSGTTRFVQKLLGGLEGEGSQNPSTPPASTSSESKASPQQNEDMYDRAAKLLLCRLRGDGDCNGSPNSSRPVVTSEPATPTSLAIGNRTVNLGALGDDVEAVMDTAEKIRNAGNKVCRPPEM